MLTDFAFIQIILAASLVVQGVMLLLLFLSLLSWVLIFRKQSILRQARRQALNFEDRFWKGRDLSALYTGINRADYHATGLERIFSAGYSEFMRLRKQTSAQPEAVVDGAQRAMRVALMREMELLEKHLSVLASIGSVSPYVGLFGTVWGIMNSFHALGDVKQATLQMVAPGISEALIATALGLLTAIPAVLAYNAYNSKVAHLLSHYETFLDEFTGILQRQAHTLAPSPQALPLRGD
jgi:biopolymer transport protein TolQ